MVSIYSKAYETHLGSLGEPDLESLGTLWPHHEADEPLPFLSQDVAVLFGQGSNGSIMSVTFPRVRSVFHVPRTKPSTSTVAGTMPFLEAITLRWSSAMMRVRSAWERIRLSNSGRKRGGAGASGSGLGASGRSNSSLPCSSRKVRRC